MSSLPQYRLQTCLPYSPLYLQRPAQCLAHIRYSKYLLNRVKLIADFQIRKKIITLLLVTTHKISDILENKKTKKDPRDREINLFN